MFKWPSLARNTLCVNAPRYIVHRYLLGSDHRNLEKGLIIWPGIGTVPLLFVG